MQVVRVKPIIIGIIFKPKLYLGKVNEIIIGLLSKINYFKMKVPNKGNDGGEC